MVVAISSDRTAPATPLVPCAGWSGPARPDRRSRVGRRRRGTPGNDTGNEENGGGRRRGREREREEERNGCVCVCVCESCEKGTSQARKKTNNQNHTHVVK